jgi:hypothetical protein
MAAMLSEKTEACKSEPANFERFFATPRIQQAHKTTCPLFTTLPHYWADVIPTIGTLN